MPRCSYLLIAIVSGAMPSETSGQELMAGAGGGRKDDEDDDGLREEGSDETDPDVAMKNPETGFADMTEVGSPQSSMFEPPGPRGSAVSQTFGGHLEPPCSKPPLSNMPKMGSRPPLALTPVTSSTPSESRKSSARPLAPLGTWDEEFESKPSDSAAPSSTARSRRATESRKAELPKVNFGRTSQSAADRKLASKLTEHHAETGNLDSGTQAKGMLNVYRRPDPGQGLRESELERRGNYGFDLAGKEEYGSHRADQPVTKKWGLADGGVYSANGARNVIAGRTPVSNMQGAAAHSRAFK